MKGINVGRTTVRLKSLCAVAVLSCASFCRAGTFTYEIDVEIRYDVVASGVPLPDTAVWGMPAGVALPSGTLVLDIDSAGNVSGSSPVHPGTGWGMLLGERLYAVHNATFVLDGGSWGTPIGNVATLTGGVVGLGETFFGDFAGLSNITGFIEDGNSGDFFSLSNGLGLDGKFEFSASGPDGMSLTLAFKATTIGAGTGWYTLALDGGELFYSNGTDAASVGITGVIAYQAWFDASAHTFFLPEENDPLLENFPALYNEPGRRIDLFSGTIDTSGTFTGTAHFAGIEFTSLTGFTTDGVFEDGNSPGFDAGNGLLFGDTVTAVMTDSTGLIDLVINGTLISCTGPGDCDDGIPCTDDSCDDTFVCQNIPNDGFCDDGDACTGIESCHPTLGCQAGSPLNCDDGVPCTNDSCDSVLGCQNDPSDGSCSDGDVCTGTESCHPTLGCQSGSPLNCNDGIPCTNDSCDFASGCQNEPNDSLCNDDDACTEDSCNIASGCEFTPIAGCAALPVPTISEWGLVIMALLLLTAGTLVFLSSLESSHVMGAENPLLGSRGR